MSREASKPTRSHIYTPWRDDGLLTHNERWFFFWLFVAVLANLVIALTFLAGLAL